jgi:hypothetical protein
MVMVEAAIEFDYHGGNFSYHIKELVSININLAIANVSPFYPGFPCVSLGAVPSKFLLLSHYQLIEKY